MPTTRFLLEESGGNNSAEGLEITEAYFVDELGGNPQDKVITAINAPDVPRLGESHSGDGRLFCVTQQVTFRGPTQAKVVCTFRIPRGLLVSQETL